MKITKHRPRYRDLTVDNGELILPVESAGVPTELRYDPKRDIIWHHPARQGLHRRILLKFYRKYRRRVHGAGQGHEFTIGPVIIRTKHCRPLLSACTLFKWRSRHGN